MELQHAQDLYNMGKYAQATDACHQIIDSDPSNAEAHALLGSSLFAMAQYNDAADFLRRAIKLSPDAAEYHSNLATVLGGMHLHHEALHSLQNAVRLLPDHKDIHQNIGVALENLGRFEEAEDAYRKAISQDPRYAVGFNQLGNVLRKLGKFDEAIAAHTRATKLEPDNATAYQCLAVTLSEQGDIHRAIALRRQGIRLNGATPIAHSALLVALHYDNASAPTDRFAEARLWAKRYADPVTSRAAVHVNNPDPQRRLRIGYISSDFRDHPVGRLIEPILSEHNRSNFEIICYSGTSVPDDQTIHLRQLSDIWREIAGWPDLKVAEQIREDRIDILLDLTGHFARNYLGVFALKPAPIQASHLGYCDTTGMRAIDYRFTDWYSDPAGQSERFHTERLVRMPHCFWCPCLRNSGPDVAPPPVQANGYITFGNVNSLMKMSDEAVALWSQILLDVSGSRMTLYVRDGVDNAVFKRFAAHGIEVDRLQLLRHQSRLAYLQSFNGIDIGLDPFPFNGDNTSFETLWMGVPLITLVGNTFASRRGFSHLSNIGLTELAASRASPIQM